MDELWEFLRVYGALMACAVTIVALSAIMANCAIRMKRLEARMKEMEKSVEDKLIGVQSESRMDSAKQRRVLNQNIANLSESVTRAILSLDEKKKDDF